MDIKQHREIYPLPFDEICKMSSFEQILGRKISEYTEDERKARWEKAMSFPGGKKVNEYYTNISECFGCKHFQKGWCASTSLPCGVNPVLTFQFGMVGMACQGLGFESTEGIKSVIEFDTPVFPDDSDLPF